MSRPYHLYEQPGSEYPIPERVIRETEMAAQRRAEQNESDNEEPFIDQEPMSDYEVEQIVDMHYYGINDDQGDSPQEAMQVSFDDTPDADIAEVKNVPVAEFFSSDEDERAIPAYLDVNDFHSVSEEEKITESQEDYSSVMKDLFKDNEDGETELTIRVKRKELLLMVLQYACVQKLPQDGIVHLIQLINCILQREVLQESTYFINKLFKFSNYISYHAVCIKCNAYVGKSDKSHFSSRCPECGDNIIINTTTGNFFVSLDPSADIKHLLEENSKYYNYIVNERNSIPPCDRDIEDIHDGLLYRQFVNSLPEALKKCYASFLINTDGSPVFESSLFSVWPIQLSPNEVPVNVRLQTTIPCGLWFGKKKPDMNVFMTPFIEEFNALSGTGIKCNLGGEDKVITPYIINSVVDSVARAPMQGLHQYNGAFGCSWCLHPSPWIAGSGRYSAKSGIFPKRTHEDSIKSMREAEKLRSEEPNKTKRDKIHVNGFISISPFLHLLKFDVIFGFSPDYMHSVLLGVGRQFATIWFKGVDNETLSKMNKLLQSIQPHSSVDRLARSIEERKFWKAKEWENWILYYSVPVLSTVLDEAKFNHWLKLVEAIYILLQKKITMEDLDRANELLHSFVFQVEDLYSIEAMTYNVHQLLHLCLCVLHWGPLWAHSGFPFENGNGKILKTIHGSRAVIQQILKFFSFQKTVREFTKELKGELDASVDHFIKLLSKRHTEKCFATAENKYFGSAKEVNQNIVRSFELSNNCQEYNRLLRNGRIFSSEDDKTKRRTNNSFALLQSRMYVSIVSFLYDQENDQEYTLVKEILHTEAYRAKFPQLKKIVSISNDLSLVLTKDIAMPCNLLRTENCEFIISMPNIYYSS